MNREFLYELLETASVSGFEEEIQRKVIKYARGKSGCKDQGDAVGTYG